MIRFLENTAFAFDMEHPLDAIERRFKGTERIPVQFVDDVWVLPQLYLHDESFFNGIFDIDSTQCIEYDINADMYITTNGYWQSRYDPNDNVALNDINDLINDELIDFDVQLNHLFGNTDDHLTPYVIIFLANFYNIRVLDPKAFIDTIAPPPIIRYETDTEVGWRYICSLFSAEFDDNNYLQNPVIQQLLTLNPIHIDADPTSGLPITFPEIIDVDNPGVTPELYQQKVLAHILGGETLKLHLPDTVSGRIASFIKRLLYNPNFITVGDLSYSGDVDSYNREFQKRWSPGLLEEPIPQYLLRYSHNLD